MSAGPADLFNQLANQPSVGLGNPQQLLAAGMSGPQQQLPGAAQQQASNTGAAQFLSGPLTHADYRQGITNLGTNQQPYRPVDDPSVPTPSPHSIMSPPPQGTAPFLQGSLLGVNRADNTYRDMRSGFGQGIMPNVRMPNTVADLLALPENNIT